MTENEQLKALLAEVERERDGFQKLAIHYDEVMRKTVEPHLPREADGTPCYGGKTAALHLVEMRDVFTDLRRKLAEAEWERDQWREQAKRGLDSVRRANARVEAMRRELEELKAFAEGHHADQPAHVFLHALTVDIPHRIAAALHAPPAEAAQDQGDGERVDVWDDEQDWKCPECGSSAWERDAKPECPTVWCADCSFHTNPGDPDYPIEAVQPPEAEVAEEKIRGRTREQLESLAGKIRRA